MTTTACHMRWFFINYFCFLISNLTFLQQLPPAKKNIFEVIRDYGKQEKNFIKLLFLQDCSTQSKF